MSIIREIKAAWRWVFNIKDEVKEDLPHVAVGSVFCHSLCSLDIVMVVDVDKNFIAYRPSGRIKTFRLTRSDFHYFYRKIS